MEFYVFNTQGQANGCLNAINNSGWFPIIGRNKGAPAPHKQQTIDWRDSPKEMLSGEWAVPRPAANRLDFIGVPANERASFLAVYGGDIRTLTGSDFVVIE
jgi:hypothetical protein